MESSGEYGLTTHNRVFDEACEVSKWDLQAFEPRKRDLHRTGFEVIPVTTKAGSTVWLVKDKPHKFNRWKGTRRFATEIEAVTWAWRAWDFKLGNRSNI